MEETIDTRKYIAQCTGRWPMPKQNKWAEECSHCARLLYHKKDMLRRITPWNMDAPCPDRIPTEGVTHGNQ